MLKWLLIAFVAASLCLAAPYAGVLIASVWAAQLTKPIMRSAARLLGGRHRAGAALTMLIVVVLILPLATVAIVAAATARELFQQINHSTAALAVLDSIRTSAKEGAMRGVQAASHGASQILIGFALFVLGAYTCLVDGDRAWDWAKRSLPLPPDAVDRLGAAFSECGRGLMIGVVLTALTQGVVATIVYASMGLPYALPLGALTFLAAFVPLIGTSTVWVPIAISLAVSGRPVASAVLALLGLLVIGTVDNVMRPFFARYAHLALPTWVVAVSMFGGLALLGFQGLIIGPVVVRLASELLEIRAAPG